MATNPSKFRASVSRNDVNQTPTKARYWVVVFAVTLAILS
jgi:hypothetical protein